MKLSGENTKEIMARLIRNDFDNLQHDPQNFDKHLELIKLAQTVGLYSLSDDMIKDLSIESGMTPRYILEKIYQ